MFTVAGILYSWGSSKNQIPTGDDLIFVFHLSHVDEIPLAETDYPRGKIHIQNAIDNTPLYWLYEYRE